MSETRDRYSLLPENASRVEHAFERALGDLLNEIDTPYPYLLDPLRTPEAFLPYLAADRGVAEWRSSDSEEEKRVTVERAWPIKRLAGTKQALNHAVETMLIDPQVIAWYEQMPLGEPYSFRVIGWIDREFGEDTNARLNQRLREAKSERDTLAVTIGLRSMTTKHVGIGMQFGEVMSFKPAIPEDFILDAPVYGNLIPLVIVERLTIAPAFPDDIVLEPAYGNIIPLILLESATTTPE